MKKVVKTVSSLFLCMVVYFTSIVTYASANSGQISTQADQYRPIFTVKQIMSKWCWAACAVMFGAGIESEYCSQTDVVIEIKGTKDNLAASEDECYEACMYTTFHNHYLIKGMLNYTQMTTHLKQNRLIFVFTDTSSSLGHAIIVCGTGDSTGTRMVEYVDPADAKYYRYTYSEFCDGSQNKLVPYNMIYPIN